jgi:hypothetical protein
VQNVLYSCPALIKENLEDDDKFSVKLFKINFSFARVVPEFFVDAVTNRTALVSNFLLGKGTQYQVL